MTRGKVFVKNIRDFQTPIIGIPIYVGRDSALGNPFKDTDAVERFEVWFIEELPMNGRILFDMILAHVKQGHHVTLLCWCKPNRCHADIIASHLRRGADK